MIDKLRDVFERPFDGEEDPRIRLAKVITRREAEAVLDHRGDLIAALQAPCLGKEGEPVTSAVTSSCSVGQIDVTGLREQVARIIEECVFAHPHYDDPNAKRPDYILIDGIPEATAAVLALISVQPVLDGEWQPTHRHLKRGTDYQVVATGELQTAAQAIWDETPATIYRGQDGRWWVRPTDEFNDGRFEALPGPPRLAFNPFGTGLSEPRLTAEQMRSAFPSGEKPG